MADEQKHLLLEVPDYDRTGGGGKQPRTYLQLGAYPTDGSSKDRGDDLLDAVGLTTSATHYFKDDYRHRNGQQHPATVYWRDDGHQRVVSDPVSLTRELRTRGGWRLHTDGNYISTTRGDRIDVIGGNYKLAVLGRMNEPGSDVWAESYWESSGGHNRDATNTPGDRVMVAWNPGRETWRTSQETVKGDTIARYQGITREFYECDTMLSKVGSADPGVVIPVSSTSNSEGAHAQTDFATQWINPSSGAGTGWPRKKENPVIRETVRAKSITSNTKVMTEAGTMTETTNLRTKTDLTTALVIVENTTVESDVTISGSTGTEASPISTFKSTLLAGVIFATELYGLKNVTNKGGTTIALDVQGLTLDLSVGFTLNVDGIGFSPAAGTFTPAGDTLRHVVEVGIVPLALGVNFTLIDAAVTLGAVVELDLVRDKSETKAALKAVGTLFTLDLVAVWQEVLAVEMGGRVVDLTVQGQRVES